jgi:STE24 endopeptidase
MTSYLLLIIAILVLDYLLSTTSIILDWKGLSLKLPAEMEGSHDADSYAKSQLYTKATSRLSLVRSTIMLPLTLGFLLLGGFNLVDEVARTPGWPPLATGLLFFAVLMLLLTIIDLPFALIRTFVIEERFGFNRSTVRTFVVDQLKGLLLAVILGGLVLSAVIWLFQTYGATAWLLVWLAIIGFSLLMIFVAPVTILPLFNKFVPLPEGELRSAIERFAHQHAFKMKGIYTIDGSRRSTKGNAYFTGFGRFRRIALYDTILARLDVGELLAVLAHEIGHHKRHHVWMRIATSFLTLGFWCWLCTFFLDNEGLFAAFRMEQRSIHAGLVFFALLVSPLATLIGVAIQALARRQELEADAFAAATAKPDEMITALKKLAVQNLSNLTPHPFTVWLHHSHPPLLDRIAALRRRMI